METIRDAKNREEEQNDIRREAECFIGVNAEPVSEICFKRYLWDEIDQFVLIQFFLAAKEESGNTVGEANRGDQLENTQEFREAEYTLV